MMAGRSANFDKNVVERRQKRRMTDVSRAVQRTRDRLVEHSGTVDFTTDLLQMHAHAIVAGAPAIPLLVVVVAALGMMAGLGSQALIWAMLSATAYVALGLAARHVDRLEPEEVNPLVWSKRLLAAHGLTGVAWAYFAQMSCDACGIAQISVIQAVVILLAMAGTAIVSAALRGAVLAAFTLPVASYTFFSAKMTDPVQATMVGVLIAGIGFFSVVSSYLNASARSALAFQSEKDGLIAALETAKSMSDEARRRAEDSNLAKSRFLATMSHELRTPLNAILGFSEVMANEVLGPLPNPTYRDYASDIHGSGQHLLNLINEILDLSRIEAGKHELIEEAVKLSHVADDCLHMMQLRAKGKDIKLLPQIEPDLPAPDHAQSPFQRHQIHPDRRRDQAQDRLDGGRRAVHLHHRQRPRHSRRRNPHRPLRLRPRLHRHQKRRTGHRPGSPHRAGADEYAPGNVRAEIQTARRHRSHRLLPRSAGDGGNAGDFGRGGLRQPFSLSRPVSGLNL
jgi:two-component system, cell cycle sensor histidine kinase PleC